MKTKKPPTPKLPPAVVIIDGQKHQVEDLAPDKLHPYEKNPTLHPPSQIDEICNSIKEFGFTVPILIDENNMILAGHGRQLAALELQLPTVPTIRRKGLTMDQKRAYVLADNKIARNAEFDWQLVAGELDALKEAGFDLDLTGFKDFEIEPLLTADWSPGAADDSDMANFSMLTIVVTAEQHEIISKAHAVMQHRIGQTITLGDTVEALCQSYVESNPSDIPPTPPPEQKKKRRHRDKKKVAPSDSQSSNGLQS